MKAFEDRVHRDPEKYLKNLDQFKCERQSLAVDGGVCGQSIAVKLFSDTINQELQSRGWGRLGIDPALYCFIDEQKPL